MTADSVTFIFLNAAIVNNFVLAMFLGICPFLGVSAKRDTAWSMGLAVIFVMLVSSICAYGINWMLTRFEIEYLRLICYIAVIASSVQLVEMTMKKYSPTLFRALGIFLPLITTNCAILGVALFQTSREYSFVQSLSFSLGAGVGFTIALMLMASMRQQLELHKVPSISQGAAMTMMLAGLLSLSFMGFAGLGSSHG
ncbi:MAG: RnfABCDGE type electron transport complex subunit A [Thiotrichales bacterium]|nr:MAG: RnfABCDGE type electron transport complex subunit A [Thiotrichales bacterium]